MSIKFNINKYSQSSTELDYYSDFKTGFNIHPATGDLLRVKNEAAIVQSVRNLLLTNFYERPFQPLLGSRLNNLLFENISPLTTSQIESAIKNTLKNYEKRADLLDLIVEPSADENGYNIRMKFSIINRIEPIEVDFFLNRTR